MFVDDAQDASVVADVGDVQRHWQSGRNDLFRPEDSVLAAKRLDGERHVRLALQRPQVSQGREVVVGSVLPGPIRVDSDRSRPDVPGDADRLASPHDEAPVTDPSLRGVDSGHDDVGRV